ncbi:hypothetical protein BGY98DRAFT_201831 [Russula aff. rugulosa BPL654]|nr:hypothetical protein BGY98DRAFT_201831 [Russula aff. rugulosa BPL654]
MKLRLKDTQLVRAQNRVKELEKQIEEWKKAGVITGEAATESTSSPVASSSAAPASRRLLQPLPHPVQLRRGVVVLRVFLVNLLLRSPPLVPPLANLCGAVVGVVCGEILVFGVPLRLARARRRTSGLGGRRSTAGGTAGLLSWVLLEEIARGGRSIDGGLTFQAHEARAAAAATTSTTPTTIRQVPPPLRR